MERSGRSKTLPVKGPAQTRVEAPVLRVLKVVLAVALAVAALWLASLVVTLGAYWLL